MAIFKKTKEYLLFLVFMVGTIFFINYADNSKNYARPRTTFEAKSYKSLNRFLQEYLAKHVLDTRLKVAVFSNSHCDYLFENSQQLNSLNIVLYGLNLNKLDNRLSQLSELKHFDVLMFCKDPLDFSVKSINEPIFFAHTSMNEIRIRRIFSRGLKQSIDNLIDNKTYSRFLESVNQRVVFHKKLLKEIPSDVVKYDDSFYSNLRSHLSVLNPCVIGVESPLHPTYKAKMGSRNQPFGDVDGKNIKYDFAFIENPKSYKDGDHLNRKSMDKFSKLIEPRITKVFNQDCM